MEATVFSNKNIGKLRAMIVDNEPYFVADDINDILSTDLEYDSIMYNDIDSEDRIEVDIDDEPLEMLNVSGVYAFIYYCTAHHDDIAAFKKWFAADVLPTMRGQTNRVNFTEMLSKPEFIVAVLTKLKEETESRKTAESENEELKCENSSLKRENARAKRNAEMLEKMESDEKLSITDIARDYGKPGKWLNELLEEYGVQYRDKDGWWTISDEYEDSGYVQYVLLSFGGKKIPKHHVNHMYWTYSGKYFIYNLLKVHGIVPLDEQEDD